MAQQIDENIKKGDFGGLLNGVPISVKDHLSIEGLTSSAGVT